MVQWHMFMDGLWLGIGAAAPLGPVNVEIARRTLRRGFRAGFGLGCGAVTIDVLYAVMVSVVFRSTPIPHAVMLLLGILGAGLLAFLGISCLRDAMKPKVVDIQGASLSDRNYVTGVLMTSLNPMTLAFWVLVAAPAAMNGNARSIHQLPFLCAGVFVATMTWVCCFAGALSLAHGGDNLRWTRWADLIGGLLLLAFAGIAIWRVASGFLL
jgi:L-lysine exporter family protein LysE/ArgO